jgi:uncharacterized membrane protein YphA (DoxX/SURF4 family)
MKTAQSVQGRAWTPESLFALVGIMALAIRLVQGWIFWAGASRRLFYDFQNIHGAEYAVKMDPHAAGYVANKLVHAIPGSVFPGLLEWVVMHGHFLLLMVWLWTLMELVVGVGLIFGLATRFLAFVSVGLNVSLMLIFGWMGSTCVDEWTMAAAGFAMGATLMMTGGGSWSLDQWLSHRAPALGERGWFRLLFSGPLSLDGSRRWGIWLGVASMVFTVGSYQYLHGAVFSSLHARVNFHKYNVALTHLQLNNDGSIRFHTYIDAGPDTGKLYLIGAAVLNAQGQAVEDWSGKQLGALPKSAIDNKFTQPWASKITPTQYGIGGITGAKAVISLPPITALPAGSYTLRLTDIDGKHWQKAVTLN